MTEEFRDSKFFLQPDGNKKAAKKGGFATTTDQNILADYSAIKRILQLPTTSRTP